MRKTRLDVSLSGSGSAPLHGDVLREMLRAGVAYTCEGELVHLTGGIPEASAAVLQRLVYETRPSYCLEIGMGMGVSTLAILYALAKLGHGRLTSIDPNERERGPQKPNGVGLEAVRRAGLSHLLEFVEQPSYVALPALLREGRRFDLIFIDGWHSFDYAFVDYFYSDLLLNEGGVLVFDDVGMPQVHHVCWFLETHKVYERLGPKRPHPLNPLSRLRARLGREHPWHRAWGSIQAYRKLRGTIVHWAFYHSDFYPWFRLYKWWMRFRGIGMKPPAA